MSSDTQQERDDLEALVQSPGWARFVAMCQLQYGSDALLERVRQRVALEPQTTEQTTVREIMASADAVKAAIQWPTKRLQAVSRVPADAPIVPRRAS